MKKRTITVPKDKDFIILWATNHSYVVLCDASGKEYFRSKSKSRHLNISVAPGEYKIETDGDIKEVSFATLESDPKIPKSASYHKPPKM